MVKQGLAAANAHAQNALWCQKIPLPALSLQGIDLLKGARQENLMALLLHSTHSWQNPVRTGRRALPVLLCHTSSRGRKENIVEGAKHTITNPLFFFFFISYIWYNAYLPCSSSFFQGEKKRQCGFLIKIWDTGTLVLHLPSRIRILADKKWAIKYGYHVSSI